MQLTGELGPPELVERGTFNDHTGIGQSGTILPQPSFPVTPRVMHQVLVAQPPLLAVRSG